MNPLRIALYCPNKPLTHPVPSGDRTIARNLHSALNRMGHECREITAFRSRWFWRSRHGWQDAVSSMAEGLRRTAWWQPHVWLSYHSYYKSPDIIGPCICRIRTIPYVLFQPMFATKRRRDPGTRVGFYLNKLALVSARRAFTNNLMDIEALRRGLPASRITYIPPGIFPEDFSRNESAGRLIRQLHGIGASTPLLLAVAQFRADVKLQSLRYLFRCLQPLQGRVPFQLLVVGDGPAENQVRAAAENCLPERTIFAGRVSRNRLFAYYSAADLFVFPGIDESLGMVYLEAQACGCPVVALRSDGIAQVMENGRTGILTDRDDDSSLARAVLELLQDPERRRELGTNARRFITEKRNLHINYRLLADELAVLSRR